MYFGQADPVVFNSTFMEQSQNVVMLQSQSNNTFVFGCERFALGSPSLSENSTLADVDFQTRSLQFNLDYPGFGLPTQDYEKFQTWLSVAAPSIDWMCDQNS